MFPKIMDEIDTVFAVDESRRNEGLCQRPRFPLEFGGKLHVDIVSDPVAAKLVAAHPQAFQVSPNVGHWLAEDVYQPPKLRMIF